MDAATTLAARLSVANPSCLTAPESEMVLNAISLMVPATGNVVNEDVGCHVTLFENSIHGFPYAVWVLLTGRSEPSSPNFPDAWGLVPALSP